MDELRRYADSYLDGLITASEFADRALDVLWQWRETNSDELITFAYAIRRQHDKRD